MTLEAELRAALQAADPAEAREVLCVAWAGFPHRRLSALVRGFGRLTRVDGVEGANVDARERAWHALADVGDRRNLPRLLATPWSKKASAALRRLEALERHGADPRTVHALLELDTGNRFSNAAGFRFWREAYALMLRWGSLEAAERVQRWPSAAGHVSAWEAARFRGIFEPLMREWVTRWPVEPSLPPAVEPLLEQLETRLTPNDARARGLLEAVRATPTEDTPRLVLADALSERGDPRGEFITLQFAHERGELTLGQRERMRLLLEGSGPGWFDGLLGQVDPLAVFRRGLLAEVRLATREPDPSLPAWRTIETLDTGGLALPLAPFLAHPNLAGVRALRTLRAPTFLGLLRESQPRAYELLELVQVDARGVGSHRITTEQLRLAVPVPEAMHFLVASGLHRSAATLQLEAPASGVDLAAVLSVLETNAPGIKRLEVVGGKPRWPLQWLGAWRLAFERDELGWFGRASLLCANETLQGLEPTLASLSARRLEQLTVRTLLRRGPLWRQSVGDLLRRTVRGAELDVVLEKTEPLPPSRVVHEGT